MLVLILSNLFSICKGKWAYWKTNLVYSLHGQNLLGAPYWDTIQFLYMTSQLKVWPFESASLSTFHMYYLAADWMSLLPCMHFSWSTVFFFKLDNSYMYFMSQLDVRIPKILHWPVILKKFVLCVHLVICIAFSTSVALCWVSIHVCIPTGKYYLTARTRPVLFNILSSIDIMLYHLLKSKYVYPL